jgi:hypothetical protein
MQSDRQNIDDFFRAKEEAWDAGSSDLQQHWQEMLVMMPSAGRNLDSKPSYYRMLKLLSGVVSLAVLVAILVILKNRKETVAEQQPQNKTALNIVVTPPLAQKNNDNTIQSKSPAVSPAFPPAVKHQTQPVITDTVTGATAPTPPKPDAAVLIKDFYTAIKKEGQVFSIPADRDTAITGKEGTQLTIRAFTFSGKTGLIRSGRISITLTEYYQYDDIIAAKLNTVSGGRQLVTGGMVHIQAEMNGMPLQVDPGRNIELKIPTDNYDQGMELFVDATISAPTEFLGRQRFDTTKAGVARDGSNVNWIPAGQSQRLFGTENASINVIDLSAEPYRVSYRRNKTVGKFFYEEWPGFDEKTLKEELYKRYGSYYDKIKLRKAGKREGRAVIEERNMDFDRASKAGLVTAYDSARYFKQKNKDSAYYSRQLKLLKYYRFEITSLGWINCDRFYNDRRPLTELTINLGEGYDAGDFVTHLVFPRLRSVMNGHYRGSYIQFRGIPADEPVQLVSVGVKDGKVVSTITPYVVGIKNPKNPVFEETSPEAFRQKLEVLN